MEQQVPQPPNKRRQLIQEIFPPYLQLAYTNLYFSGTPAEMKVFLSEVPPCVKEANNNVHTNNWVVKLEPNSHMRPDIASCAYKAVVLQGFARLNLEKPNYTKLTEKLTTGESHLIQKNDCFNFENTGTSYCYIWLIG